MATFLVGVVVGGAVVYFKDKIVDGLKGIPGVQRVLDKFK